MEPRRRSEGGTADGEASNDGAGFRRALEEEKALRRAEVAALWAAIHRLEARQPSPSGGAPLGSGGPVVVPGLPGVPEFGRDVPGRSTDWRPAVPTDCGIDEDLFPKTVASDTEDDILAQLLGGGVTPTVDDDEDGHLRENPPTVSVEPPETEPGSSDTGGEPEFPPTVATACGASPGGMPASPPPPLGDGGCQPPSDGEPKSPPTAVAACGARPGGTPAPPPPHLGAGDRQPPSDGGPGGMPAAPEGGWGCRRPGAGGA